MTELPIARLARWWAHRNDRPADKNECMMCHEDVPRYSGEWYPALRQLLCGQEDCLIEAIETNA